MGEADPLVQMSGVDITLDNSVELKNLIAYFFRPCDAVKHELFTDMLPSAFGADGIARVADVSASADIVGMKDV